MDKKFNFVVVYFLICSGLTVAIAQVQKSTLFEGIIPQNSDAVVNVEAGRYETAQASWWGFDPEDATKSLQAALNSEAKRVIVENMNRPWIVTGIKLASNKEIIFEPGTVVEAKRGEFLGKGDCLFEAAGCTNLAIKGNCAVFKMHKSDYHKSPYELAEWRHALSIRGCRDVHIEGLKLLESGGDGIYLGTGRDRSTNFNITIRDVICDGNNRQGISVITAKNLLIEDCIFRNTNGTAPQAGIDLEPNHPEEKLVNCVLRNCISENNIGQAYHLYLGQMNEDSAPVSILFENCISKGCGRYSTYVAIDNRLGMRTVRGKIEYINCRFEADDGGGVYIRGNEGDGCSISFRNCEIIRRDKEGSKPAPITIQAPKRLELGVGNIEIKDCVIRDTLVRKPVGLIASPITRLQNLTGSLAVETPLGRRQYILDEKQLNEWFPSQGLIGRIPGYDFDWKNTELISGVDTDVKAETFRLRRQAEFLIWGKANRPIQLEAIIEPVGRYTPSAGTMKLMFPDSKTITLKPEVKANQLLTYRITPRATGPLKLQWQSDSHTTIRLVKCSAPMALIGDLTGLNFIHPQGSLYFFVPAGIERFAIQVQGQPEAEKVKAVIRDAKGRVVEQEDNITSPHVFVLEPEDTSQTQIWSITLGRASEGVLEDVSITALGLPPVFSTKQGELFIPRSK